MFQEAPHQAFGPEGGVEEGEGAPHQEVYPGPCLGGLDQGLEDRRIREVVELQDYPALGVGLLGDFLHQEVADDLRGPEEGEGQRSLEASFVRAYHLRGLLCGQPAQPFPGKAGPHGLEEAVHLPHHLEAPREKREVGVKAPVLRVVVARAQVDVSLSLVGEEEQGLGVHLALG